MPMTDNAHQLRTEILLALLRNGQRRRKLDGDAAQARDDLAELLDRGVSLPEPLTITEMARDAGISRETAYKLLRGRGGEHG
jgi:hypothetical protein